MTYPILHPELRPTSEGYSAAFPTTYLTSITRGGAPRRRKDFSGGLHQVNVAWTLDEAEYNYLMGFYRTGTQKGVLPFIMDLIIETSDLRPYTCWFAADTLNLTGQTGLRYNVSATLLALELEDSLTEAYQQTIVLLKDQYGDDAPDFVAMLDDIVENRLPVLSEF